MEDITATPEWAALRTHRDQIATHSLRDLFAADANRGTTMRAHAGDLYLDYAKHLVTEETIELLIALARRAKLAERIDDMFRGARINVSEDRPALHAALRMPRGTSSAVDIASEVQEVHRTLDRMAEFCRGVHSGATVGHRGDPFRTVVAIGIGGSALGPAMAYEALEDFRVPGLECRFVSNVDPAELADALADLVPEQTLFIVSSKTFTTAETLINATGARHWIASALGEGAVPAHFAGVSANVERVSKFGIVPERIFPIWDWVGGRYSFDSAIGLPLMLAIGPAHFEEMLAGLHTIDEHFRTAPWQVNLPVLQGMLGVWYRNFHDAQSHAVLPYAKRLHAFPAYIQQLTMESTGKVVRRDGSPVTTVTGEVYWGQPGTDGQHAFYQLLHQGTDLIPVDFLGFARQSGTGQGDYPFFLANLLGQAAALAFGRSEQEVLAEGTPPQTAPHRVMPGNRPSSIILAPQLTPSVLGQIVALYEHTVFVKGAIWDVNCFDQWGVELGKSLAERITSALTGAAPRADLDSSTRALIEWYSSYR